MEPVLTGLPVAETSDPAELPRRGAARRPSPRLDALIDAIATIRVDAPLAGDTVAAHLPTTRRAGSKPFFVEGLNTETGEWEDIVPSAQYVELQAGVSAPSVNTIIGRDPSVTSAKAARSAMRRPIAICASLKP